MFSLLLFNIFWVACSLQPPLLVLKKKDYTFRNFNFFVKNKVDRKCKKRDLNCVANFSFDFS
jgi:hypothetical protein